MTEKMLETAKALAKDFYNSDAIDLTCTCVICGAEWQPHFMGERMAGGEWVPADPVLTCPNGCIDLSYTRDSDGTLRERPTRPLNASGTLRELISE
jgi:hypothetical protein